MRFLAGNPLDLLAIDLDDLAVLVQDLDRRASQLLAVGHVHLADLDLRLLVGELHLVAGLVSHRFNGAVSLVGQGHHNGLLRRVIDDGIVVTLHLTDGVGDGRRVGRHISQRVVDRVEGDIALFVILLRLQDRFALLQFEAELASRQSAAFKHLCRAQLN